MQSETACQEKEKENKNKIISGWSRDDKTTCESSGSLFTQQSSHQLLSKRQITVFPAFLWTFVTWNLLKGTNIWGMVHSDKYIFVCLWKRENGDGGVTGWNRVMQEMWRIYGTSELLGWAEPASCDCRRLLQRTRMWGNTAHTKRALVFHQLSTHVLTTMYNCTYSWKEFSSFSFGPLQLNKDWLAAATRLTTCTLQEIMSQNSALGSRFFI